MRIISRRRFSFLGSSSFRSALLAVCALASMVPVSVRAQHSYVGCDDVKATDFKKVSFLDKTIYPGLNEPIKMTFAKDGMFYWIERPGAIKRWDPVKKAATTLYSLNVHLDNTRGGMGITLDPAFATNGFMYIVYMPNINPFGIFRLSRFTLVADKLQDEKIVLDVPITVGAGQHASGAMAWDNGGNLFWGLGDNSIPGNYAEISSDQSHDARRTAGSSNNLNGKILRIHPEANGTYTIPAGNMFPVGTAQTKPEIYAMGFRNPWSLWYDKTKGWLLEGEVGPDATSADASQGPAAQEEINMVKDPGFYGWPFLGGHNISYKVNGSTFDPNAITNDSPLNTGIKNLPPARPALLAWGHDGKSQDQAKWPVMGGNDGTGMVGILYRYDPALDSKIKLPPQFDGSFFFSDWELKWLLSANLDDAGNTVTDVKKPFGTTTFYSPIGMTLGTDGALYVIEYGDIYFDSPSGQKISRLEYTGTCLPTTVTGLASAPASAQKSAQRHGHLEVRLDQGRMLWVTPGGHSASGTSVRLIDAQGRF